MLGIGVAVGVGNGVQAARMVPRAMSKNLTLMLSTITRPTRPGLRVPVEVLSLPPHSRAG